MDEKSLEADLKAVCDLIKHEDCKNIGFLTGAGISVAAGIPDFRSPGGMYDTLQPELLTATEDQRLDMKIDPTTVVCWELFSQNQLPYLELRRPFILGTTKGRWLPTLSHYFIKLCHEKGKLTRLLTQNIDGLDFNVGIPEDKIVCAHGTMGIIECEYCCATYDRKSFCKEVEKNIKDIYNIDKKAPKKSKPIPCQSCKKNGVKPATVLYGRPLPKDFFRALNRDVSKFDILFIIGTSLGVSPANSVPGYVNKKCPCVLINREKVGSIDFGEKNPVSSSKDSVENKKEKKNGAQNYFLKGDCDVIIARIIKELGWTADAKKYKSKMAKESSKILSNT